MEMNICRELWLWGLLLGLAALVVRIGKAIWWRPRQIERHLAAQGITGPSYKLLYGNLLEMKKMVQEAKSKPMELSHRILPRIIPYYDTSLQKYGRIFLYWFGTKPRLNIHDVDLIKEILSTKFGHFEKPPPTPVTKQLAGNGLASLEGHQWAKHRRIINPAFHVENLKGMIPTVAASAADMLTRWNERVGASDTEIEVSKEFRELTADVIARTAFGSSYVAGKHIFDMQSEQTMLVVEAARSLYIPGFRFLPTKKNMRRWKLHKEIRRSLKMLINEREQALSMGKSKGYGNDLLGIMMATNKQESGTQNTCMTVEDIIGECEIFFFAGHETTSVLLTWTMVLLGMHQEWQETARKEVLDICGKSVPNSDNINRLKIVTMLLNESLRLYPPGVLLLRHTYKEMQLGDFTIPAGTELLLPILAVHHDPKLWGNDADEFNPQRFAEGVANAAKHPLAFMPFSFGPRICIGLNFAMIEAKVVLAMILQQFSFSLSPSYSHAPTTVITLQPQFGAQIIVSQL
uniref:Cytochrome P450 n=1 Tax=Araucaria cunninghamii TaxID=56994 RepID=A0A0D6QSD7_ARACU